MDPIPIPMLLITNCNPPIISSLPHGLLYLLSPGSYNFSYSTSYVVGRAMGSFLFSIHPFCFLRFLYIVGSTDCLDTAKVIEAEMSQLEEAKKFHLSLYAHVNILCPCVWICLFYVGDLTC